MEQDYVVVGAGFAGSVFAERIANVLNKKVLLVEKQDHIGGHCYDCLDENGILIHKYGPHIFHTKNGEVWDYLSKYTKWNLYQHEVKALIDGQIVPVPFNLNTLRMLFPKDKADRLEDKLVEKFGFDKKVPILELRKADDSDLKFLAEFVYEKIFLHYTVKQWGFRPEELSGEVTGRVPVFISRDNRYFQDEFQGMPQDGFTPIFEKMIENNKNIKIVLNTDYKKLAKDLKYKKLIYTGPIDYFFDYKFGKLDYRTLDFEFTNYKQEKIQSNSVINYPQNYRFLRSTEFKLMTWQKAATTTTVRDYPRACTEKDIPYYPLLNRENMERYKQYEVEAKKYENIIFIGRLAEYKYFNMDESVASALKKFKELL